MPLNAEPGNADSICDSFVHNRLGHVLDEADTVAIYLLACVHFRRFPWTYLKSSFWDLPTILSSGNVSSFCGVSHFWWCFSPKLRFVDVVQLGMA